LRANERVKAPDHAKSRKALQHGHNGKIVVVRKNHRQMLIAAQAQKSSGGALLRRWRVRVTNSDGGSARSALPGR